MIGDVIPVLSHLGGELRRVSAILDTPVKDALQVFLADTWPERLRRLLTPVHQLATALHLDTTPAQRRRLLDYLRRNDAGRYQTLIERLGLRR